MSFDRTRVAVVYGGISSEREVSCKSGEQICAHLDASKYEVLPVEIAMNGDWILNAKPIEPKELKALCDVTFLTLHGSFGEDGKIQGLLELVGIPYTGSGVLASALCMNKEMAKKVATSSGVHVPKGVSVQRNSDRDEIVQRVTQEIGFPCFVKPNTSGSSIGVTRVNERDSLRAALESAFHEDAVVLVEQYIHGRELTCGVMGNASVGGALEVLPPVEIMTNAAFFDYRAKYESKLTREICPAPLTAEETSMVQGLARQAHELFGCDGLSRTDMILQDGIVYFLETNTIPGMTEQSLCPKEAVAMGNDFAWLIERLINLVKEKWNKADAASES